MEDCFGRCVGRILIQDELLKKACPAQPADSHDVCILTSKKQVDCIGEEPVAEAGNQVVILALLALVIARSDDHVPISFCVILNELRDVFWYAISVWTKGNDQITSDYRPGLHIGMTNPLLFLRVDLDPHRLGHLSCAVIGNSVR